MKTKALVFALLLTCGALTVPVNALADPLPVPSVSCIKDQSDVALHLRFTNTGTQAIAKGKKIAYAYKSSAGGAEVKGTFTLENALAPGQRTSTLVNPVVSWTTPIYQCTAMVKVYAQATPVRP